MDDPQYLWLLFSLLQVDEEDLHEVAEHGGGADLPAPQVHRPLQDRLHLRVLEQLDEGLEEALIRELVPDGHAEDVVEQHEQADESSGREV